MRFAPDFCMAVMSAGRWRTASGWHTPVRGQACCAPMR